MVPEQVLNAVYEQLRPLVLELGKYNLPKREVQVHFEIADVTFKFK